jgi:amphi-Trp domain-containing protein
MTDVRVERSEMLTRAEAAVWLRALSAALAKGGDVTLPVGGVKVGVHIPEKVRAEFEIEVEGDQVEIELEFSWRTTAVPEMPDPEELAEQELEQTDRAWQV